MKKKTTAMLVLTAVFVIICLITTGPLSLLSGLVAAGIGIGAWAVDSAGLIDENERPVANPDEEEDAE